MNGNSISAGSMDAMESLTGRILFEDNHLIIVNKKASEIVQGDKTGDQPLSELVKAYIAEKYGKPGKVFLGVLHRIDRPVTGAVVFARTSKALTRMNAMLREHKLSKTYLAVVQQRPAEITAHLSHYLLKNEKQNKSYVVKASDRGAKKAELVYEVLSSSDRYHLLGLRLLTGRHHQIRAQLAAIGSPIKGDLKYGFDRPNKDGSIHLHAKHVEFMHPVSQSMVSVDCPLPVADPLWKFFSDCL